jgi:hypothetical protein
MPLTNDRGGGRQAVYAINSENQRARPRPRPAELRRVPTFLHRRLIAARDRRVLIFALVKYG